MPEEHGEPISLTTDLTFHKELEKYIMCSQSDYNTISNILPTQDDSAVRRFEDVHPLQVPSPVPTCLFLERFPLDQRDYVKSRFFSNPGIFSGKKFDKLRTTKGLVKYVRRDVCRTLAEYNSLDAEAQRDMSDVLGTFEAFRENLDRYPEEAEALARLALDSYIHHQISTSVYMVEEETQRGTPPEELQQPEPDISIIGYSLIDSYPFVLLVTKVCVSSPTGESQYICALTLNQRRRTSPLGLAWSMGGIPVRYRRAIKHLVSDLADQFLSPESETGKGESR